MKMTQIKDLIQFGEIKDVIDIDSDIETYEGKKTIVSDYIVSKRLKESVRKIISNISKPKSKSVLVIGGYGSGKSHLLAWIVSLLENEDLVQYVSDDELKTEFKEELNRQFAVVQFELQPSSASLSEFFFDRVEKQLDEKYEIKIPAYTSKGPEDFKKDLNEIISIIKEKDPKMGFVVLIDEISDFLKAKTKEEITRDLQFLRILGQVSMKNDFRFIGSMQEHVFSNPKFVDQADNFGRVSERFVQITISKEDIKEVISKRILKKSNEQKLELESLLSDYKEKFPPINANPDEFIDIFPIHPYVIKIFDELPYFEKRGVIQFSMEKVSQILKEEFPKFITYDSVFDEINSKHTIRNLDNIISIVDAVETLDTKIDTLPERDQKDALRLVKALAILAIYGKTKSNGATPEELANTLLILSDGMDSKDKIAVLLNRVRTAANGQYIVKDKDYYYLDVAGVDYEAIIERKIAGGIPKGMQDEEFLKLIKYSDLINSDKDESYIRNFTDTCAWVDKKSFRLGSFIYDDNSENVIKGEYDFNLVVLSPYKNQSKISSSKNTAILSIGISDELNDILKRLAAIRLLISENFEKTVMNKLFIESEKDAKKLILKMFLESNIEIAGEKKKIKSVIPKEPDNFNEFFHDLKEKLFNDHFTEKYPKYPKFLNQLAYNNIKGEVEDTITSLTQKGESALFSNTRNMLVSLGLLNIEGYIDTSTSIYSTRITEKLRENKGKNVSVEELMERLSSSPFGLDKELIQLILVVLTYNGEINLRKKGGGTITSSDLAVIFKSGLRTFHNIPYAIIDDGPDIEKLSKLFRALSLNPGLIRDKKEISKALKEFRTKILAIKEDIDVITNSFSEISLKTDPLINLSKLEEKINLIDEFPFEDLYKIKTANDFKKIEYLGDDSENIKAKIDLIINIKGLITDYNEFIYKDYFYVKNSLKWMEEYPNIFSESDRSTLVDLEKEISPLIGISALLKSENRRMLKGKLQQYKLRYGTIYFSKHEKTIGQDIKWQKLENINQNPEMKRLRNMKTITGINALRLNKMDEEIISLSHSKCNQLKEEQLHDTNYYCPWCKFPLNLKGIDNINQEIDFLEDSIEDISKEWTTRILDDIEAYKDNIGLLSTEEQNIITEIRDKQDLPDDINQNVISALNNLFKPIEPVKINPNSFIEFIFSDSASLDYDSFTEKLDQYKKEVLGNKDKRNIRILWEEE